MPVRSRVRSVAAAAGILALVLGLAACSPDASVDAPLPDQVDASLGEQTEAQLQAAVEQAMAASGASGSIVGVWAPWAGSWVTGLGTIVPEGAAVTTDMTIPAGPVTRSMTCDVLYGMVHDGRVKLDDSVTTWVSGVHGFDAVTLGDLCDSTGGVASYTPAILNRMLLNPSRPWAQRELLSYGMAPGLSGEPGATFADSDTGYLLLGMALSRASRETFAELYEQYVTKPLKLTHTDLPERSRVSFTGMWSPNDENGVVCAQPMQLAPLSPTAGVTAYGVETTIADLGRYTQALALQVRSFDDDDRFGSPLPAGPDAPSWYTATGGAYQAGTLVGQFGSLPGHIVAAYADRNTGMTVAVVLNNSRADPGIARVLAWELAAIASKVPATGGGAAPEGGLPWTAEEQAAQIVASAMCPLPAGEPAS